MTPLPFTLDARLAADTSPIIDLPLSAVRLMRDARYPWIILVPCGTGLSELTDLPRADRIQLMDEIASVSEALVAETNCLKLNVAAIGNIVRQLHIHIVARFEGDAAWPGPVWGAHPPIAYDTQNEADLVKRLASRLGRC
jgi:diadenosine tetraphosphate (Ap4A) HIT family hydrolase